MCEPKFIPGVEDGDVDLICNITNKRIIHSNQFGMYCEDYCGIEEDKKCEQLGMAMINEMNKLFGFQKTV
jgi:hypothetical protein